MPQIRRASPRSLILLMILAGILLLAGCGDKHAQSDLDQGTGRHAAGWLPAGHAAEAKAHMETCADCHGADFRGGIAKVACTQCHLGNQLSLHPVQWGNFAYALHGSFVTLQDPAGATCALASCHATNLDGVGGSGPSCTLCHMGGKFLAHPAGWNTAADLSSGAPLHASFVGANGTTVCRNAFCHGPNLQGVFLSGPACNACHNF